MGSGKSRLKGYLAPKLLGIYLNADEIEAEVRRTGEFDFHKPSLDVASDEVLSSFHSSSFLSQSGFGAEAKKLRFRNGKKDFREVSMNSYFASVTVDFIRRHFLAKKITFTFETVMSHPSKVEWLEAAQRESFRTYLYFVATDDPSINVSRVKARVRLDGHAVPEERIIARYHRSIGLLSRVIRCTNRAYIFDNSIEGKDHQFLVEITEGRKIELKTSDIPAWFRKAVLDKSKSVS